MQKVPNFGAEHLASIAKILAETNEGFDWHGDWASPTTMYNPRPYAFNDQMEATL